MSWKRLLLLGSWSVGKTCFMHMFSFSISELTVWGDTAFLSHLSTCLIVVPYLQDKLYLHQLGNESSLGLTCSLCNPNKSSTFTLMNKKCMFWKTNALMFFCPLPKPQGLSGVLWRWTSPFSPVLQWKHFIPKSSFSYWRISLGTSTEEPARAHALWCIWTQVLRAYKLVSAVLGI